ncbi:hypothetical protein CDAR_491511 [Caerostris darwini]|uniref:Uncharacterized protein n=1 Tax=Caerostris darwini TaxID=1538125 RepID=A0AAV4X903_9ARAC|nr:hypothetical protein CDAR_491511 [Caerostris darwini]
MGMDMEKCYHPCCQHSHFQTKQPTQIPQPESYFSLKILTVAQTSTAQRLVSESLLKGAAPQFKWEKFVSGARNARLRQLKGPSSGRFSRH